MPLYEYRCTSCGHSFEKIQSFSAEPEKVCPRCGGELIRPMTAPALQFKGAGWYINDYSARGAATKSGDDNAAKPPDSSAEPAAAKSDTPATSSEAKPAAASPAAAPAAAAPNATPSSASGSTSSTSSAT